MSVGEHTQRIRFPCQSCGSAVSTPAAHAGKSGRCPTCQAVCRIPQPGPSPAITDAPVININDSESPAVVDTFLNYLVQCPKTWTRWVDRIPTGWLTLVLVPAASLCVLAFFADHIIQHPAVASQLWHACRGILDLIFASLVWSVPMVVPISWYALAVHKVRALRQIFYFSMWLGPLVYFLYMCLLTALVTGDFVEVALVTILSGACLGFPWFATMHWPARWLTPYLLALFVFKIRCPSCHEANEVRSRWQCSCGYVDHRHDRNILLFSCPKCQERIGYTACLRCESTILV